MSRQVTLAQLRADVVEQCDLVSVDASTHITTTSMNRWIVQSTRRFVGLLYSAYGERYFESPHSFSTVDGTAQYDLPDDFYQLYQVAVTSGGRTWPIYPATQDEMTRGEDSSGYPRPRVTGYRVLGSKIEIVPTPREVYTVKLRYGPTKIAYNSGGTAIADLSADTDYIDGINGWEDWILYDVCTKAKIKQDEDPSGFMMLKSEIEAAITTAANERDRGPRRTRNTYDRDVDCDEGLPWP